MLMDNRFQVNIDRSKLNSKEALFFFIMCIGVFMRFSVMAFGHNFDFDSYCIVGKISGHFENVYAETSRYNYGPIFFMIQGLLYRVSEFINRDVTLLYRIFMVSTLTLVDIGIAIYIACKHSKIMALVFFLNPISIIITGYHNQFDNIAILLGLISTLFYNEEERINKKDYIFVVVFALSLMVKHILFIAPAFIMLRKNLNFKKKILYACVPPVVFLMSFLPFVISNEAACEGVLNNVFLYRSFNNSPFLSLFSFIKIPEEAKLYLFVLFMIIIAYLTRKYMFEKQILIYLIALVTFSSAIANQYLVIPMVALCLFETGVYKYFYMVFVGIFLTLHGDGFAIASHFDEMDFCAKSIHYIVSKGYCFATLILFFNLILIFYKKGKMYSDTYSS